MKRSEMTNTLRRLVRLQIAAAEYLRVTRTRGSGEASHYLPPANRSVEEIKTAEAKLRALLPNAHALAEERSDDSQQRVVGASESKLKGD